MSGGNSSFDGAPAVKEESTDMVDRLQASWIRTASEGVSLRSGRSVGVASLRELDKACQQGLMVELITVPSAAAKAQARTSCIAIWQTTAPDVLRSPQVLLVDGSSLVVEGQMRHANSRPVRQEASARAHLKRVGLAERLR